MREVFCVLVCILINLRYLASSENSNTTSTIYDSLTSSPDGTTSARTPSSLFLEEITTVTSISNNTELTTATQTTVTVPSTTTEDPEEHCRYLQPPEYLNTTTEKRSAKTTWYINRTDLCNSTYVNIICIALEEENKDGWDWVIKTASATANITTGVISVYIENLSEFTNYTCNGTLRYSYNESQPTIFNFRTDEEVASPPSNVSISNITSTTFYIKWEKPVKNPGVFVNYHVNIRNNGPNYFVPEGCDPRKEDSLFHTNREEYAFNAALPDYTYGVVIFFQNGAGSSTSVNQIVTTKTSESEAPRDLNFGNQSIEEEENMITGNLTWKSPCTSNGPITTFYISLKGYYTLNESVDDIRNFNLTANDLEEYSMRIEELQPAFSYTISIRADEYGTVNNLTFVTQDNVPGPPIINSFSEKGSSYFAVSWSEPDRRAGKITKYEIEIVPLGPLYQQDRLRCPFQNETVRDELPGDTLVYNFTQAYPYSQYNIMVMAFTSRGIGNSSSTSVVTNSSVPEQPDNFTFSLKNDENIGLLSWTVPCNINGPIQEFVITLNGIYTVDGSHPTNHTQRKQYELDKYEYTIEENLLEAYNYTAKIRVILEDETYGDESTQYLTTPDGYPGEPSVNVSEKDAKSFKISWEPPTTRTGRIRGYRVNVTSNGPVYKTHCILPKEPLSSKTLESNQREIIFVEGNPYYSYDISVEANTSRGYGDPKETAAETDQSVPENVQIKTPELTYPTSEKYDASVRIAFEEPCRLNGPLEYFELILNGTRPNHPPDNHQNRSRSNESFVYDLKPDYNYSYSIKTVNGKHYANASEPNYFLAPAGVPQFPSKPIDLDIEKSSSSARITLTRDQFDESVGEIQYVTIFLSDRNVTGGDFDRWYEDNWPKLPILDDAEYYQITQNWWNPFENATNVTINIGNDANCKNHTYCKPLENDKEYYLIIRLFTRSFYRNSPTIYFKTDDISKLGTILGLIFGVLGLILLGGAGFLLWQKKLIRFPLLYSRKTSNLPTNNSNTAVPTHKFVQYCKNLENNPEKCMEEYTRLAEKTKEAVRMHTNVYSGLTENRRKNRYTNILPYDETRVKLLIEEDDEIGSDYINASYIKGFSSKVEYIATQGPLQTTCRDFWKMVIQENVSIIVMVTQFVEQNKEKCFKYFPNNHESMIIGEDMVVKCAMELDFGTYCVRTLQVKKDNTQIAVTHMQYLDWPDFNVPTGTETMLQFCYQLRQRLKIEGGCVVVHCSAGVGRTGTIIATDIVLQSIKAGNNIDIFNTVLELRKQRTNMVQTVKQYMYIYSLIKDSLEQTDVSVLNENREPIYGNLPVLHMKHDGHTIINKEKEVESQF